MNSKELYLQYETKMQRQDLFKLISEKFQIKKALYPGSYIHISPSFYIPEVVYVDTDKRAKEFFADPSYEGIIEQNKVYSINPEFRFHGMNYTQKIPESEGYFDLLISQYAGLISQACKKYLKINGILLANNSHVDAGMAYFDKDYSFIGVINFRNKKFYFSESKLEQYFIPKKKGIIISEGYLKNLKRGLGYTKTASHYIFKRKN